MAVGLFESAIASLPLLGRGKVRDIYAVDDQHLLIVASDRLSAFDVVLPDPVPGKGEVLTRLSRFWFDHIATDVPNHLSGLEIGDVVTDPDERAPIGQRAMVVRRLEPLPVEAIVRGYLIGSGWKDYQASGAVSGVTLPSGLQIASPLPEPVFTPSSKAEAGAHDENITYADVENRVGVEVAARVRELALTLYTRARDHALARGIIIADTKFEFGLDADGQVVLIDEMLTPDSSRFWPADEHEAGVNPPAYDKQYVRDYLETLDWDKTPPAPALPADILAQTAARYAEAEQRLTGPAHG